MKTPVTDAAVDEYVSRLRGGVPLGTVFPSKISECDFTPAQREKIRRARVARKAAQKNGGTVVLAAQPPAAPAFVESKSTKALTKLKKMLYLQAGKCFFCGMPLKEEDANIEHLNPKSLGGASTEDNEVVCHKALNSAFGNMNLKRKFEFILRFKGDFRCPGI